MSCNKTSGESHGHNWPTNCSGWNGVVDKDSGPFVRTPLGSMEHHLHTYLQNTRFWNMTDSDVRSLAPARVHVCFWERSGGAVPSDADDA